MSLRTSVSSQIFLMSPHRTFSLKKCLHSFQNIRCFQILESKPNTGLISSHERDITFHRLWVAEFDEPNLEQTTAIFCEGLDGTGLNNPGTYPFRAGFFKLFLRTCQPRLF